MSITRDEELERVFTEGRWMQAIADAERCVEIFELKEARLRPITSWQLLPEGYEVSAVRSILAATPIEDDEMRAEWPTMMAKLHKRVVRARSQYKLWSSQLETIN